MASAWAHERAMKILNQWEFYESTLSWSALAACKDLVDLMAEAIDDAEEYGEKRYSSLERD